jgi:cysteinyl-tRNA synthetase
LRNRARKNGLYQEADQIRDRLKKKGILLVDGTGKKNCYATTWSYIGE